MSWLIYGHGSAVRVVARKEVFVHHLSVSGTCTMCGNAFNVTFTKETPDGAFIPDVFRCPCEHFAYYPEHNSHCEKDTHLGRTELCAIYDLATRKGATDARP